MCPLTHHICIHGSRHKLVGKINSLQCPIIILVTQMLGIGGTTGGSDVQRRDIYTTRRTTARCIRHIIHFLQKVYSFLSSCTHINFCSRSPFFVIHAKIVRHSFFFLNLVKEFFIVTTHKIYFNRECRIIEKPRTWPARLPQYQKIPSRTDGSHHHTNYGNAKKHHQEEELFFV